MKEPKATRIQAEQIQSLAQGGMTLGNIGAVYDLTPRQIRGVLKHYGLEVERKSSLELTFETFFSQHLAGTVPQHETQHRFDLARQWKFDVAWPEYRVGLELHGGNWAGGRHSRPKGIEGDAEKNNAAIELGWVVLVYTTDMLRETPIKIANQIQSVLLRRGQALHVEDGR